MKKSGKKIFWIIIGIALLVGVVAGAGIYLGGKAIQKQKEEELAKQEQLLEEEKQKEAEKLEEEARRKAEEERKEQERLEAEEAAKRQEEEARQAALEKEKEAEAAESEDTVIVPEENTEEEETQPSSNGYMIAIDAGHQGHGNSEQEPIGPGASETKAKVTSGTHGAASGLDEYELNLIVALKLKQELLNRGYQVFMIRETHDVDISNSERAKMAAASGSDILVRIHANGLDNTSLQGALTMAPASDNPFLSQDLILASQNLSQIMVDQFCAATGANNMGVQHYNNMSGINWSTIPVTIIEMGFMTNPQEDVLMATEAYQDKMVQGMANGIDAYFGI